MTILTHPAVNSQSSWSEKVRLMLMKAKSKTDKNYRITKLPALMTTSSQSKTVPSRAEKTSPQIRIRSNSRLYTNTHTRIDYSLV